MPGTSPTAAKRDTTPTAIMTQRSPLVLTPTTVVAVVPHHGTATTTAPNLPVTTTVATMDTSSTSTDTGSDKHLLDSPTTTRLQMSSVSIGNRRKSRQQETIRRDTRTSTGDTIPRLPCSPVCTRHLKAPTANLRPAQDSPETLEALQAMLAVDTPTTTVSVLTMPTPTT